MFIDKWRHVWNASQNGDFLFWGLKCYRNVLDAKVKDNKSSH